MKSKYRNTKKTIISFILPALIFTCLILLFEEWNEKRREEKLSCLQSDHSLVVAKYCDKNLHRDNLVDEENLIDYQNATFLAKAARKAVEYVYNQNIEGDFSVLQLLRLMRQAITNSIHGDRCARVYVIEKNWWSSSVEEHSFMFETSFVTDSVLSESDVEVTTTHTMRNGVYKSTETKNEVTEAAKFQIAMIHITDSIESRQIISNFIGTIRSYK